MRERNKADRRRNPAKPRFPLKDSGGELVIEDRRIQPDRRLDGIEVEWLEMRETAVTEK